MDEAIWVDGDKHMWDGRTYETREEAATQAKAYGEDGFETQVVEAEGVYAVYTRRVVTEIVLDGEAPL